MKKLLLIAIFAILPLSASLINFETPFKATNTNGFNFELRNKTKRPIAVTLVSFDTTGNPEAVLTPEINLEAAGNDETYVKSVRANTPPRYYIVLRDGATSAIYKIDNGNPKDTQKTVYVSYENGNVRTQKGVGLLGGAGFNRATQSGLSLKNNISSSNIKRLDDAMLKALIIKFIPQALTRQAQILSSANPNAQIGVGQ